MAIDLDPEPGTDCQEHSETDGEGADLGNKHSQNHLNYRVFVVKTVESKEAIRDILCFKIFCFFRQKICQ